MNTNPENTTGLTIQAFDFQEQAMRTLIINGEPWFVAADVCRILGHSNPSKAVAILDEDERSNFKLGRQGFANIVSESGLYTLMLRCDAAIKPGTAAHTFRRWVTAEVLPALRKQGAYSLAKAAERDAAVERLEHVRGEVVSKLRDIDGMAAYAAEQGCLGRRISMDRVRGLHTVGRLRLDALRLLWDLESGGQKAALTMDGTEVVRVEDEAA
jgi:prophage antirepressor-like protein